MSYDVVHRYFLRTVASQGVLTYSNAQKILAESFPGNNISIEVLIKQINNKINLFQQSIEIVIDEVTSEQNVVFLSLGSDDATKSLQIFSVHELNYFRVLIEQIMTTESRQITPQYALNLVNYSKLSKTQAQKLLKTWTRMYYLAEINSNYALGIRAIHEFKDYLHENMPDTIQECYLCTKIVFRGYNCPPCGMAIHMRCLSEFLRECNKWPCCEADFHNDQLESFDGNALPKTQQPQQRDRTTQLWSGSAATHETSDDEFQGTIKRRRTHY